MNYLNELNTDNRTLQDVVDAIDAGEGYNSVTGKTYAIPSPDKLKYGNSIPIWPYVESYLTASELESLYDPYTLAVSPRDSTMEETYLNGHRDGLQIDWAVTFGRFLESIPESAFDINRQGMTQDSTWDSDDDNAYFADRVHDYNPNLKLIEKESDKFLLTAIEDGFRIQVHDGDRNGEVSTHQSLFMVTGFDHPGNPYYEGNNSANATAIKYRALVCVLADMTQWLYRESAFINRMMNHAMLRWGYTLERCRDLLPELVRISMKDAIEDAFYLLEREETYHSTQEDLDIWWWHGIHRFMKAYDISYESVLEVRRKPLFTNYWEWSEIAGVLIGHDSGVDVGYQGISTDHLFFNAVFGDDDDKEKFLNFIDFYLHVASPEPVDDVSGKSRRMVHGSNSNIATHGKLSQGQGFNHSADLRMVMAGYMFPEALPLVWSGQHREGSSIESTNLDQYTRTLTNVDSGGLGEWPNSASHNYERPGVMYLDLLREKGDVYTYLRNLKDHTNPYVFGDDSDAIKFEQMKNTDFVKVFGEGTDTGKIGIAKFGDFSAQIWNVDLGWRGSQTSVAGVQGGLGSVWHKDAGTVIMGYHYGTQRNENIGANAADQYACNGIWGRKSNQSTLNGFFSTLHTGHAPNNSLRRFKPRGNNASNWHDVGRDERDFRIENDELLCTIKGRVDRNRWGTFVLNDLTEKEENYTVNSSGLFVEKIITSDATDEITQLIENIPLVVAHGQSSWTAPSSGDLVVEFDTGSGYNEITNENWVEDVVSVRLTKYNGSIIITVDGTEHPGGLDMQLVDVTAHTTPLQKNLRMNLNPSGNGVAVTMPSSVTLKYHIA